MRKFSLAIASAAFFALPIMAQYDQNFNVEGKYVPEYINHDRIGLFPKPVRFPLEKSALRYSLQGVNADFTPQAVPIQATGWNISHDYASHRGYLELDLGSWLESSLSAGYRFIDTRESALGIRLQHNSTSLWKPSINPAVNSRMERYDESIGIYGNHTFGNSGKLSGAIDYHIGNFDYYGYDPYVRSLHGDEPSLSAPTQTLNDIAARLMWQSVSDPGRTVWNAGAGVRYFGYRRLYAPGLEAWTGGRETDVNICGAIAVPTSTKSSLGLDLNADVLTYSDTRHREGSDSFYDPEKLDTYGLLSLTPYYRFTRSGINIKIGARVDLTFNAGPKNSRYDLFHIAPDASIDYNAGPVTLFVRATGGTQLHTLAGDYELNYYQMPMLTATTPVYTPIDAKFGFSFGPFSGFHGGFDIAFRASRGQYMGGFYQCWLNGMEAMEQLDLPATQDGRPVSYDLTPGAKYNIAGFSFGLNAGYDAGRYFKISADAHYQHQKGSAGYFNGYDRPEFTISAAIESNPWSRLKLKLGYNLRALRYMPVEAHYADTNPLNSNLRVMYRLPNLSMLNFGISYGINKNLHVRIQADNLLNRKYYYMPGLPEPGIRFSAGFGFMIPNS